MDEEAEVVTSEGLDESNPEAGETTEVVEESPKYKVKVDGEELEVPLDELLNGYSRTSDYTRKSQALAAEREKYTQLASLAEALERDPKATLTVLSQVYGIGGDADEPTDPEEARIRQLEQFVVQQQQREQQAIVDRQFANLHAKFGDFDDNEVIAYAVSRGIGNVEDAFKSMHFERMFANEQATAKAKAEEESKTQAKRAAGVVAGGASPATGTVGQALPQKMSFREAWAAAKKAHS